MEMKLLKLELTNFKGVKHQVIEFDGKSALVKGANGAGKTTLADSFYFIFAGCNTEMTKNPVINPFGEEECQTRVEAEITIDGRPCQVAKMQKFKRKTDEDGKTTSSTTNSYEVNGVSKTERDFVADMVERGLNMDRFLIFSHPDAFFSDTSKKGRDELRKVLFEMAEDISDETLADENGASEVKALLEKGYKLDEVESMNKASIRKITEIYGKQGELVDAKIEGLLSSKEEVDVKALTEKKHTLESKISEIDAQINGSSDKTSAIKRRLMEIDNDVKDIQRNADREFQDTILNKEHEITAVESKLKITKSRLDIVTNEINSTGSCIKTYENSLNDLRNRYKDIQEEVLDDKTTKCPTCGRVYAKSKVEQIKDDFDKSKSERLTDCKQKGEETQKKIEEMNKSLKEAESEEKELNAQITSLNEELESLRDKKAKMPTKADISGNKDFQKLMAETEELEKQLDDAWKNDNSKLVDERAEIKAELDAVKDSLALDKHNKKIDESVAELRESKKKAEINKAQAEKIIDQVAEIKKEKNERLGASINSHFNIISFKLWDLKKNGTYDDVIDMMIDGKPASVCANGSLLVISKLDCLAGLQNYFNQHIPVFLDDAALLTANSSERISLDSQLIMLIATDGINELKIEKGE